MLIKTPQAMPGAQAWDRTAKRCRQRHEAGEIGVDSLAWAATQRTTDIFSHNPGGYTSKMKVLAGRACSEASPWLVDG